MILKWSMEAALAAAAMVITAAGSVYTTVYHSGQTNQQIAELQIKSTEIEAHVAKHDDQLDAIKQQNATTKQSLDDIKDAVHDIQTQVRK
jgi:archaellum component FlaC